MVYCVVDPENNILFQTVREDKKQALHEFDMLQPLPWPLAEKKGFRVRQFEMTKVF